MGSWPHGLLRGRRKPTDPLRVRRGGMTAAEKLGHSPNPGERGETAREERGGRRAGLAGEPELRVRGPRRRLGFPPLRTKAAGRGRGGAEAGAEASVEAGAGGRARAARSRSPRRDSLPTRRAWSLG